MSDGILSHHWSLALIGAHYIPYALAAFGVIALRLFGRRMRLAEVILLFVFFFFLYLEHMQLSMTGARFEGDNVFGMRRYYSVFAPLLWIFAAKGASVLWMLSDRRFRMAGRVLVCVFLAWVFAKGNVAEIVKGKTKLNAHDTEVAVAQLAPIILEDYTGPVRQPVFKRSQDEYFTGLRPVVSCPFGAAGWAVRGDHCHTTGVESPYPEDYLCFPLGSRFAGITNIDVRVYKYVTSVHGGLGTEWLLFRRRTTPGKNR